MPDLPERYHIHCSVGHNIEDRRGYIPGEDVQTFALLRGQQAKLPSKLHGALALSIRQPGLLSRTAKKYRDEDPQGVEDCVQNVQGLEHPIKWIPFLRAEHAQDQKQDGKLGEADCRAVNDVRVVIVLHADVRIKKPSKLVRMALNLQAQLPRMARGRKDGTCFWYA